MLYGDGVALCIQQIGECVNGLPDGLIESHREIPWHQIRGMRNIVAHAYEGVDPDVVWDVLTEELPRLSLSCEGILQSD